MAPRSSRNPQYEINNNSGKQRNREYRRAQPIVKPALSPHSYALRPPMERKQRIQHGSHSDEREQACTDLTDFIAEIEEANGETTQDDSEVEP